ncbi:hypothetical protein SAMN02745121_05842 [Nannocystis exedens]|uniref:Receptor L domain-containing protein n=1 Tax=Nannocystis exedens TaxID=54 RepID=A0A1I2DZU6_9BACT|nr:hypothetical protein [Nannocystis exedens]PCC69197.1 triose-phosphate isomerase [Nannocystis exedens]SFE86242.1 hypothetical protein SAMN02745121_05842 [Nannocystis exedens]
MTRRPVLSLPKRLDLHLDSLMLLVGLGLFAACPGESPGDTTATTATADPTGSTSTTEDEPEPETTEPTGTTTTGTPEESTSPLATDSETGTTTGDTTTTTEDTTTGTTTEDTTAGTTTEDATTTTGETTSENTTGETSSGSTTDETSTGTTGEPIDCAPDLQVLQGSYSIENSLDVDALAAYKEITGDLTIHAPGLASLAGLQCLQRVGGDLTISETGLTSLDGLDSLEEVGGQLLIEHNTQLADLHALGNLVSVGATPQGFGYFRLEGNPALKDLKGLGALSFVGYSMRVEGNGIETLAGLGSTTIHGELRFEYNPNLVDVLDVAGCLPKNTLYFTHNKKLWCGNAEMAYALMQANGFKGNMFLYDNLNGCGDL